METRYCKQCNNIIPINEEQYKQFPWMWKIYSRKKFCSEKCAKKYYYIKNPNKNVYSTLFDEHNNFVKDINNKINGEVQYIDWTKGYNPDIIKEDNCYEVELFRKAQHLKKKIAKWDNNKKHILIVCVSQSAIKLFDESYIFDGVNLIKLNKEDSNG